MRIHTPVSEIEVRSLQARDVIAITGLLLVGRDAVLPKLIQLILANQVSKIGIDLEGSMVLHSAVSPAGIGPTSSNKLEIESSIPELSKAGVKMHIGKGRISSETIKALDEFGSVYAITPPLSALLTSKVISQKVLAFPEEGMEALHLLEVVDFPVIIAAVNGKSIYD